MTSFLTPGWVTTAIGSIARRADIAVLIQENSAPAIEKAKTVWAARYYFATITLNGRKAFGKKIGQTIWKFRQEMT